VVCVYLKVTIAREGKVEPCMARYLVKHVVEERDA